MADKECCSYPACMEKFSNTDLRIEELKKSLEKTNMRIDEVNKKADTLENALSNRLTQIETKFDIYNDLTTKKLDGLERKIDNYLSISNIKPIAQESKIVIPNQQDSFRDWVQKVGMKFIEYGLYSAVVLGLAKGFKLF